MVQNKPVVFRQSHHCSTCHKTVRDTASSCFKGERPHLKYCPVEGHTENGFQEPNQECHACEAKRDRLAKEERAAAVAGGGTAGGSVGNLKQATGKGKGKDAQSQAGEKKWKDAKN